MLQISVIIPLYNKGSYIRRALNSVLSQTFDDYEIIGVDGGSTGNGPELVSAYSDQRIRLIRAENNPLVSVILPTFNREQYITKSISSVLRQGYTNYEIIVVDDGSTDNTKKVLEPYSKKIRYIYQENSGVSTARNAGIKIARGEWIAFLDSDDEWNSEYLSSQVQKINKYRNAIAHLTNGLTINIDGCKSSLFVGTKLIKRFNSDQCLFLEKPFGTVIKYGSFFTQAFIVRKDVLLRAGLFDEQLSIAEDIDVIARVALQGPFTISRRELVNVYRRKESLNSLSLQSFHKGITRYQSFGKVYLNLLNIKGLTRLERKTISSILSSNWRALGNALLVDGRKLEARNYYKKSFLLHPSARSLIKYYSTYLPQKFSMFFVIRGKKMRKGKMAVP